MSIARFFFWIKYLCACLLAGGFVSLAQAKIIDSSRVGFTLVHTVEVPADAQEAFRIFTEEVGQWWSSDHTFSGDANNMQFALEPGGGLRELWGEGNFVAHLDVVNIQPGRMLVLRGGLGPLQFMAVEGSMFVVFAEKEGSTDVTLTYAVGGYHPKGVSHIAGAVDGVLGLQLGLFEKYAN